MNYAPIALFVYNRPWHTKKTVEALKRNILAEESDLYIYSDSAKVNENNDAVDEVRDYIKSTDGFKSVKIIEQPKNIGLANSIINGVTSLCDNFGRVIVIEDDLVTSPYFLHYMNNSLDKYEKEHKVMQIAGYMFQTTLDLNQDAVFLPFISSWGWGTWKRAWVNFDASASGYEKIKNNTELRKIFDLNGNYKYFKMLRSQKQGKVDSWAIRWYLSVFLCEGLTLYPRKSFVKNIGFDGSGVNCTVSEFSQDELDDAFTVSSYPVEVKVTDNISQIYSSMALERPGAIKIIKRIFLMLKKYFNKTY